MNDSTTREALLEAARRCVRDDGLAGATSRRITEAAGANLAAITYHFGSKDELLAEALFDELAQRLQPALDQLAADAPAELRLAQVVATLDQEFDRHRRDTRVYLEALLLASRDRRYRRSAIKLYRSVRARLAEAIADLRSSGPVPAWVDPEAMASLVLAVANGIALQSELDPRGPDHRAMSGQFAQLLLASATPGERPGQ
jgi:AcrR family transcriptional regulator